MKATIHPIWHHDCAVTCSCGNTFFIGSTQESLQIDICSKCHPFFTGEVRFVDRQGRVDRFLKKQQEASAKQAQVAKKKKSSKSDVAEAKSYRELLREQQNLLRKSAKSADVASTSPSK